MKVKRLFPALFTMLFFYSATHAQTNIIGKVLDSGNVSLPFATVVLREKNDTTIIKGTVTDQNGNFIITHSGEGDFTISVSLSGYKKVEIPLKIAGTQSKDIGVIHLIEDVKVLKGVEVVKNKSFYEYKIDRTIVNVQNNPVMAGGTALDVLERSPGVIVNKQRNSISLNGKEGLIIMIDGKISYQPLDAIMQMLGGMNSNNIEKIELISNPPAKYDAGSNAGIINIILHKSADLGTNGSFSVTEGYGRGNKTGLNLNLNHRSKRLNVFGDVSFSRNHTYQYFTNDRLSPVQDNEIRTSTVSDRDPVITNFNGRIGFDYTMNDKISVSGLISGFDNVWHMNAVNNVQIDTNNNNSSHIRSNNTEKNHWQNIMGDVNLNYRIKGSEQINMDFIYLYYHDQNPTNYNYQYFDPQYSLTGDTLMKAEKVTPINIYVGKIDYSKKLGKVRWELGAKGTFSNFTNDVSLSTMINNDWVGNPDFTRVSYLRENISAIYTSTDINFNETFTVNGGLRYEYTTTDLGLQSKGSIIKREYGNLFPTLFISKKIATDNTLQFSYGRRITRPAYTNLAPFIIFLDPTTYFYGNESLQPAIADALKLNYIYRSLMFSIEFNHQNNAILQYEPTVIPDKNLQVITSLNLKYRNNVTFLLSLPVKVNSWWSMENNIIGVNDQIQTKHLAENIKINNNYYRINSVQSIRLPSSFMITLSGFYQSKSLSGLSQAKPFGSFDFGAQKKIQKGHGAIKLSFTDLFWTATERNLLINAQNNLNIYSVYKYEPRILKLTYTYNFGNSKIKRASDRETGSEEIMRRVR